MAGEPTAIVSAWRNELPSLPGRTVTLREPVCHDIAPLGELLALPDATRFGVDDPLSDIVVHDLVERAARDRAAGIAVTYAITLSTSRAVVGLVQVRQLDPTFETAEWECTLAPSARGSGAFLESARLIGSFAFGVLGAHRLEARVAFAERPRERRAAQARCGAGRHPAPFASPRRRVSRSGAVVDLEGGLGRALGLDGAPGPLMCTSSHRPARMYVGTVIAAGAALLVLRLPVAHFEQPLLFVALFLLSSCRRALKVTSAADDERLDDVGVVRGRFRVAAAARPAPDDARRRGERVQPVPFEQARSATRCTARSSAWRRSSSRCKAPGSRSACCRAAPDSDPMTAVARPLVGAATVYFLLNTGLIATAIALSTRSERPDDVEHQLPVERAELLRRRRHRGARRVGGHRTPATGSRR